MLHVSLHALLGDGRTPDGRPYATETLDGLATGSDEVSTIVTSGPTTAVLTADAATYVAPGKETPAADADPRLLVPADTPVLVFLPSDYKIAARLVDGWGGS